MHQRLRLRRPHVEYSPGRPQDLQDMAISVADSAHPADEAGIQIEVLHGDMLFNADGDAVQGTDGLLVLGEIGVQVGGTGERGLWEELGDAVDLFLGQSLEVWFVGKMGGIKQ